MSIYISNGLPKDPKSSEKIEEAFYRGLQSQNFDDYNVAFRSAIEQIGIILDELEDKICKCYK